MSKTLRVIEPFSNLEIGDILRLTENGNYAYENKESSDELAFSVSVSINQYYAQKLIDAGYLEEIDDKQEGFVNIFTEIDTLLKTYQDDMSNLDADYIDAPACLKLEKRTVLENMIKLLSHLKALKK